MYTAQFLNQNAFIVHVGITPTAVCCKDYCLSSE